MPPPNDTIQYLAEQTGHLDHSKDMLLEERGSFSQHGESGNAEELQMNINLTDSIPVQRNYTAVPRPL